MYKFLLAITCIAIMGAGCSSSSDTNLNVKNLSNTAIENNKNTLDTTTIESKLVTTNSMKLTSPHFQNQGIIPDAYSCDGLNINPTLDIGEIPERTKSLALIVDDPDAPNGTWTHWVVWNIDPSTTRIEENSVPTGALQGTNSSGAAEYEGPCPPSGTHRYYFRLFALDSMVELPAGSSVDELRNAMHSHMLDEAELMGTYGE